MKRTQAVCIVAALTLGGSSQAQVSDGTQVRIINQFGASANPGCPSSIGVRAELANEDGSLRPGMFMTVRLEGRESPALLLPEEALVPEQGRTWIYVVKDGRAQRREVVTGGRRPGIVAVQSGLADDERVVVEGTLRLRDGMPVVEVPRTQRP